MPATPSSDCSERLGRVRQPSAIWRAGGSASGSYAPRTSASADAAREAFAFRRRRITSMKGARHLPRRVTRPVVARSNCRQVLDYE